MSRPCVLGQPLEEAMRRLAEAGVTEIEVAETAPPRARKPAGPRRVVRQRTTAQGVSLVVAATVPSPQGEDSHD